MMRNCTFGVQRRLVQLRQPDVGKRRGVAALQRELRSGGRREGRRASSQREEQRAAQHLDDVDRGQLRPNPCPMPQRFRLVN